MKSILRGSSAVACSGDNLAPPLVCHVTVDTLAIGIGHILPATWRIRVFHSLENVRRRVHTAKSAAMAADFEKSMLKRDAANRPMTVCIGRGIIGLSSQKIND